MQHHERDRHKGQPHPWCANLPHLPPLSRPPILGVVAALVLRAAAAAPVETITLNKVGDFLELDFGRLFTWLGRGMLLGLILAIIGGIAGGI